MWCAVGSTRITVHMYCAVRLSQTYLREDITMAAYNLCWARTSCKNYMKDTQGCCTVGTLINDREECV